MKFKYIKIKFWPVAVFLLLLVFVFGYFLLKCEKENLSEFRILHKEPTIEQKQLEEIEINVLLDVPFTVQAPFAEWEKEVFQDACEEASVLMAIYWLQNKEFTRELARQEILAMAEYQEKNYGHFHDFSIKDTAQLLKDYSDYHNIEIRDNITNEDIKNELRKGNLVIVPINGQAIGNPYYTQPGPERHMLVIIGYDSETKEFITNDPGTKHGKGFRYNEEILYNSIRDYPTGHNLPIVEIKKTMIVIEPNF